MIRQPPRSTRTDTLFPDTPLFRSDQAVRAVCKEAAAKTLGVPVLNWDDSWPASPYTRVEKTSTGYRARVAGDTGGTIHVFTCYIGDHKQVVQQVVKEQPAGLSG